MNPIPVPAWKKAAAAAWPRRICSFAIALLLVTAFSAEGATPPAAGISAREPSEAYLALVRADEARDGEDWQMAVAAYEDALERYRRIAEAHPEWESDIVQYRIIYCENQIATIRSQVAGTAQRPAEQPDAGAEAALVLVEGDDVSADEPGTSFEERYLAVLQENAYLRRRVAELMDETEETEAASEESSEAGLRGELAAAVQRAQQAEARVLELEKPPRDPARQAVAEPAAAVPPDARYQEWLRDALARENAGDAKGALAVYERMLEKYPEDAPAMRGQVRCLMAAGHSDKAIEIITARSAHMSDPELAILLGTAYGAVGRFKESAGAVAEVIRDDPWNARARAVLGAALLGSGEIEDARVELEKALVLDPQLPEACYNLAWILVEGTPAEREKGREYYRRNVELGGAPDAALERRLSEP